MDADSSLDHVFFPDSGVVSVVAVYADDSIIEMATIGREGFSGVQAILGAKRSSAQLVVHIRAPPQRCRTWRLPGPAVHAGLPKAYGRLRPGLSRTGHGISSVQRSAQPQAAVGALAAHDA